MFESDDIINKEHNSSIINKWRTLSIVIFVLLFILSYKIYFKKEDNETSDNLYYDLEKIKDPVIAKIFIEGPIYKDTYRDDMISNLAKNDNIKALIIVVNSPGGEVTASESLYNSIYSVTQNKPVVVLMDRIATSAAYMISLASDYIIAMQGTITGSIGVLLETFEYSELANKIGIQFDTYTAGVNKGFPSNTRSTPDNVKKSINNCLEFYHKGMISTVAKRRKISIEEAKNVSTGEIFVGIQALNNSLIDEIGYEENALHWLNNIKNIDTNSLKMIKISLKDYKNKQNSRNMISNSTQFIRYIFSLFNIQNDEFKNSNDNIALYSQFNI